MDFSSRITRTPRPYEPERGSDAVAKLGLPKGDTANLVAGAAGCSPFLAGVIDIETDWIRDALTGDPDAVLRAVLDDIDPRAAISAQAVALRQAKRRVALLAALADLGGVWALEQVTGALTELADRAVHAALCAYLQPELARGKVPGKGPDDLDRCAGMVALAMGKMGAGELNYSSDIDVICLFDESQFDPADCGEARSVFIKVTRKAAGLLSDRTGDGYVFRTDLRLRPDASVTPVCISMDAAERYYESVGRTWERAAYIKARPCAGDIEAGERFLQTLRPFVWRKHLDFAAIQDAHDMRLKIRDHKGLHGAITLPGHDMKLGRGGIREIEFFTQTRQLIAGGRDPELRSRETVSGLRALAAKGWVDADVAEALTQDYRAHREVEHRLQMVADAQTHALPNNPEGFARLAAFMDVTPETLEVDLRDRLERVAELTEGFFAPGYDGQTPAANTPELSDTAKAILARWEHYPALRSDRAVAIFERLRPDLLARIARTDRPDETLLHVDGFLAGLPAGVQLFSLFEANPHLVDLVIDICAMAPHLAKYLSRNSGVFDAVIGGDFFSDWPARSVLCHDLATTLERAPDFEARLNTARRWAKEWHFRAGVHLLRGLIDADEAGRQYSELAEVVVGGLWPHVVDEFSTKHGRPPGTGAMALAMGSLGAGRLTAASDLDLIVIYDAPGDAQSDGRRPLDGRTYYSRLTKALVTALTAPMPEGTLYEVDMRLRPSGRQGPVATSFDSFQSYQTNEAWTWEHLALTRARPVAGNAELCAKVTGFRTALLASEKDDAAIRQDTQEMRKRLSESKPAATAWDPKNGPGRMMDIELLAEAAALLAGDTAHDIYDQLAAGVTAGWITNDEKATLTAQYRLCWRLQSAARLLTGDKLDPKTIGQGAREFILRQSGADTPRDLSTQLRTGATQASAIIDALLARPFAETAGARSTG